MGAALFPRGRRTPAPPEGWLRLGFSLRRNRTTLLRRVDAAIKVLPSIAAVRPGPSVALRRQAGRRPTIDRDKRRPPGVIAGRAPSLSFASPLGCGAGPSADDLAPWPKAGASAPCESGLSLTIRWLVDTRIRVRGRRREVLRDGTTSKRFGIRTRAPVRKALRSSAFGPAGEGPEATEARGILH